MVRTRELGSKPKIEDSVSKHFAAGIGGDADGQGSAGKAARALNVQSVFHLQVSTLKPDRETLFLTTRARNQTADDLVCSDTISIWKFAAEEA